MRGRSSDEEPETPEQAALAEDSTLDSDDEAVIAGTLRSPWKWEELVVESAVVGGRTRADGGRRWRRRLGGLAADYRLRIAELRRDEPESARHPAFERDLKNLGHLREFALPIVDELAQWPDATTWGEWLDRFVELAGRALRRPDRVLDVLASLRPMASVGPVTLEEVRDVLRDRLVMLDWNRRCCGATAASSSARRIRRAAGRSVSCLSRGLPSASCRNGRTRIRCCSTSAANRSTRRS